MAKPYKNLFSLLIPANFLTLFCVLSLELHGLHAENGVLENLQALTLLAATILYLSSGIRCHKPVSIELIGLGLLCFSFSLREVDIELLPLPSYLTQLFTGTGRTAVLLLVWASFGLWARSELTSVSKLIRRQLESGLALFLATAALLLIAGAVIDRSLVSIAHPRLYEELLEVNAYLFLLVPAYRFSSSRFNASAEGRSILKTESASTRA